MKLSVLLFYIVVFVNYLRNHNERTCGSVRERDCYELLVQGVLRGKREFFDKSVKIYLSKIVLKKDCKILCSLLSFIVTIIFVK